VSCSTAHTVIYLNRVYDIRISSIVPSLHRLFPERAHRIASLHRSEGEGEAEAGKLYKRGTHVI